MALRRQCGVESIGGKARLTSHGLGLTEVLARIEREIGMALRSLATVAVILTGALLGGCQNAVVGGAYIPDPQLSARDKQMMAVAPAEEFKIPIERYQVGDPTGEAPGTIVIDTSTRNLYFVLPGKQAIKYRVATGAEAYGWTGRASIGHMTEWPTSMPTASIMQRCPEFPPYLPPVPLPAP